MTTLTRKTTRTSVEVEVDISDLVEAGWHHEEECHAYGGHERADREALTAAVSSLHRQAHPAQPADPFTCREEPCRSLDAGILMASLSSKGG